MPEFPSPPLDETLSPRRLLILMSDTGGGHRSAAKALAAAMSEVAGANWQTTWVDYLTQYAPFPFNRSPQAYAWVIRYPLLWHLLYHSTNGRWRCAGPIRAISRLLAPAIHRAVVAHQPDLLLSVHPWASHAGAKVAARFSPPLPFINVITDPVSVHPFWVAAKATATVVATATAEQRALQWGAPANRLHRLGLPIHPRFTRLFSLSREAIRAEMGLQPDRFTVLIMGGGEGAGGIAATVAAIEQAHLPVQLIVVAGRNGWLLAKLQAWSGTVLIRVFGFVEDMAPLMRAADLLITKAGPGTIHEALACGLPMLLSSALPGQETGNVALVVEPGAGCWTPTPAAQVAALRALTGPGGAARLAGMAAAARALARPEAAHQIARLVISLSSSHS